MTIHGVVNPHSQVKGGDALEYPLAEQVDRSLTFDGVTNTSSGTIVINGSLLAQDFSNDGVFVVNNGGSLDNNANDLVSGGGSRSTINGGGVIFLSDGTAWELNGALLVNNGEINGTVDVNYGSLAKGGGNFAGMVNVNDGGEFSPGNSPGSATLGAASFGAGGAYVFEMRDATGAPGNGIDFIAIGGALDSRFTIRIVSLDAANQPGPAANFDPSQAHSLTLLTAARTRPAISPTAAWTRTSTR
jgi:fibronectin-binding autotransporter adhesin